MAMLMRSHDWSATSLGSPSDWTQPLRTIIRLLLNTRHPMFVFWGPKHICFYNDAYSVSIGPERHPVSLGQPGHEVWAEIWDTIGPQIEQVMSGGGATWHENQLAPITRHGRREDMYWTYGYSPIDEPNAATGVGGVLVVCTETTAQVLAQKQQAAREAASQVERHGLNQMFDQAPSFIAMLSGPEHRFELANQAYLRLIGKRDILGRTVAEVVPESIEQGYLILLDQVFRSGEAFVSKGAKLVFNSEPGALLNERYLDFIYQPVKNDDGAVTGIFVEGADVTDRALAEAALRELNETLEQRVAAETSARIKSEAALRHAQKMEAVGQLTGGIAHDFNNMLQAIMGGITLARRRIADGKSAKAAMFLDSAYGAAERAAVLTQRLLGFGRRQALDPQPLIVNALIRGLEPLIQRTVGAAITVEVQMQDECWPVRTDANQLENALLNLAINARDAMQENGGRLTIQTLHVALSKAETRGWEGAAPGEYVRITVSDTGTGMSPDVLAHAFEPFYTTKPSGKGTGLGLSQIDGFVRQSRGVVALESTFGVGTQVHLFLARSHDALASRRESGSPASRKLSAQDTAIAVLLVEDEAAVRTVAAEGLRDLGYCVLEASDGPAGLKALQLALSGAERTAINVLVTDVGLPGGLNGRQLADAARELIPDLPVLLITGYAGDAIEGQGRLSPGMEILAKPFDMEALAGRVQIMISDARPLND